MNEEEKKKVDSIPSLKVAVATITKKAFDRIDRLEGKQKEIIIKKHESIRDICIKARNEIEERWKTVKLDDTEKKALGKYLSQYVNQLTAVLDLARKANVDVYEMRYGKKLQINKMDMKFEDFVKMKRAEIEKRPENQVIDVTEVKNENR